MCNMLIDFKETNELKSVVFNENVMFSYEL